MNLESSWAYTANPFSVGHLSYKKMDMLITDTHDSLLNNVSDPDISNLYNNLFLPAYNDFKRAYARISTTQSRYGLRTDTFEILMQELGTTKIDEWDIQIQATSGGLFKKTTPNYKMLFSNGRASFQSGSYEQRILAVTSFKDILTDFPVLAAIQTDVDGFLAQLKTARTEQQGYENELSNHRNELELANNALALVLHRILGFLIYKYADNPRKIEDFFELQYLRQSSSNSSTNNAVSKVKEDTTEYETEE
jgi:hypothetical protein